MYHYFVRRRVRQIFEHLNRGDLDFVVGQFAPDAEHWFSGSHALGGRRRTPDTIASWYRRLARVFPGLHFDVQQIMSSGPPWHTRVVVEWIDSFPLDPTLRSNQGVFVITLRWGRATQFHVYCDTGGLERNLALVAGQGIADAAAPAIDDAAPAT